MTGRRSFTGANASSHRDVPDLPADGIPGRTPGCVMVLDAKPEGAWRQGFSGKLWRAGDEWYMRYVCGAIPIDRELRGKPTNFLYQFVVGFAAVERADPGVAVLLNAGRPADEQGRGVGVEIGHGLNSTMRGHARRALPALQRQPVTSWAPCVGSGLALAGAGSPE